MKTVSLRKEDISREWYVVDVAGKNLGRVATEISKRLIGKHKPTFTPHTDNGDFIIVLNADKVVLSGSKEQQKTYFRHSGYFGSEKFTSVAEMREKHPERIIAKAVSGMLPKNKMRNRRLKRLKVYLTDSHNHSAQQPKTLEV